MAQTDINIDAGLIANPSDVPVVQGDTITITASGGSATLFFSHGCQAVMSPPPDASVTLTDGDSVDYTFTSSALGNYMVVIAGDPGAHAHFLPVKSNNLTFTTLLHSVRGGGGPNNQLQGQ
jgi:hypothetical protein